jgi:thiol-disulfide isomerase/thioredoxin
MRNLIPILAIIASLQSVLGQQTNAPGFITEFGEYKPKDGRWTISISAESRSIGVTRQESPSRTSGLSPSIWKAQTGWFALVENDEHVWAYDGNTNLLLIETTAEGLRTLRSEKYTNMLPEQIRQRLSPVVLDVVERHQLQGRPAPALDAKEWFNTTNSLSLDQLQGKVVLLDFWGQWCPPCVERIPESELLQNKFKNQGLVVIGVHSNDRSDDLGTFLKKNKITFPIVVDSGETARRYSITGWPTYFLVDKLGNVAWGFSYVPPKESQIQKLLE